MRIVLTGGVTGGHIYPALAIGEKFKERQPDCEVLFVGSSLGLENKIVPQNGFELKTVTAREIDRRNVFKMFGTVAAVGKGRRQAYKILSDFRPDVVVSTGSFVSVPVVLAAHKYGAGIFIHEQNAFPGLANRSMLQYADRLFTGFKTAAPHFREQHKLIYSGNPVRNEFYNIGRASARKRLGIPDEEFVIFVFGGSLGAAAMNDIGIRILEEYGSSEGITVVFGTGNRYYDDVQKKLRYAHVGDLSKTEILSYVNNMPDILAASNVVISRSGALSVAEITVSGRAAIFIPSPNVTGDHQYYNAKEIADGGGAVIVHEDDCAGDRVVNILKEMITEPELLEEMERCSRLCAPLDAAETIYENIVEFCGGTDVR